MKLGIMGAHGTGKTTFAMAMAAHLKQLDPSRRVGLVSEVARSCPFPLNENATHDAQAWVFHQQFIKEIEAAGRNDIIVCDRTVFDALAYSRHRGSTVQVTIGLDTALDWFNTYDKLFFLRPVRLPKNDGFRSASFAFQTAIDSILAEWIEDYGLFVKEYNRPFTVADIEYECGGLPAVNVEGLPAVF